MTRVHLFAARQYSAAMMWLPIEPRGSLCGLTASLWMLLPLPAAAETAPRSPGSELFVDGRVWRLKLEIPSEGLKSLRSDPRQYVRGTLREGTNVLRNVAVRLKGRTGSFRALDDNGFHRQLGSFVRYQRFHGRADSVEQLGRGPHYLHESGSQLFRAAGLPAPQGRCPRELNGRGWDSMC